MPSAKNSSFREYYSPFSPGKSAVLDLEGRSAVFGETGSLAERTAGRGSFAFAWRIALHCFRRRERNGNEDGEASREGHCTCKSGEQSPRAIRSLSYRRLAAPSAGKILRVRSARRDAASSISAIVGAEVAEVRGERRTHRAYMRSSGPVDVVQHPPIRRCSSALMPIRNRIASTT